MSEIVPQGDNLPVQARVKMARKAHDLHVRGRGTAEIARHLGISQDFAAKLVDEELYRSATHRPDPTRLARARMEFAITTAAEILDSGQLHPKAQNWPALLKIIIEAQNKLDAYDGTEMPKRTEHVNVNIADLTRMQRELERRGDTAPTIEAEAVEDTDAEEVAEDRTLD